VIARLRPQLASVAGLRLFLNPVQDLRSGGRQTSSTYQYTLIGDDSATLRQWSGRLLEALKSEPVLTDLDSDLQQNGVQADVQVDHDAARRLGISASSVDAALYDAFGQRQVGTIYTELNQYHVVMEWAPRYAQSPRALEDIYVPATTLVRSGASLVQLYTGLIYEGPDLIYRIKRGLADLLRRDGFRSIAEAVGAIRS
jgi:multidrug efflux pump